MVGYQVLPHRSDQKTSRARSYRPTCQAVETRRMPLGFSWCSIIDSLFGVDRNRSESLASDQMSTHIVPHLISTKQDEQ